MNPPLSFEWDEDKAAKANPKSGHVPFELAAEAFFEEDRVFLQDTRNDYGEDRYWLFASPEGVPLRVTFTVRGEVTRIISAHVRKRKERL